VHGQFHAVTGSDGEGSSGGQVVVVKVVEVVEEGGQLFRLAVVAVELGGAAVELAHQPGAVVFAGTDKAGVALQFLVQKLEVRPHALVQDVTSGVGIERHHGGRLARRVEGITCWENIGVGVAGQFGQFAGFGADGHEAGLVLAVVVGGIDGLAVVADGHDSGHPPDEVVGGERVLDGHFPLAALASEECAHHVRVVAERRHQAEVLVQEHLLHSIHEAEALGAAAQEVEDVEAALHGVHRLDVCCNLVGEAAAQVHHAQALEGEEIHLAQLAGSQRGAVKFEVVAPLQHDHQAALMEQVPVGQLAVELAFLLVQRQVFLHVVQCAVGAIGLFLVKNAVAIEREAHV